MNSGDFVYFLMNRIPYIRIPHVREVTEVASYFSESNVDLPEGALNYDIEELLRDFRGDTQDLETDTSSAISDNIEEKLVESTLDEPIPCFDKLSLND